MLELLGGGERTAAELAAPFDMTQPAVSQHLRVLREAGLVEVRKEGRFRVYCLDPTPLRELFDWASYFESFWRKRISALGSRLAEIED